MYLEPIFGRGTLRQEQARFQRIDREFRMILNALAKDPRVAALLRIQDLKAILTMLLDQLNRCQASLNNYLSVSKDLQQRPRFFVNISCPANRRNVPNFLDFYSLLMMICLKFWDNQLMKM